MDPDCRACILRQAEEVPARFGAPPDVRGRVLAEARAALARFDPSRAPPEMGGILHAIARRALGRADPYAEAKARDDARAAALLPEVRGWIAAAADPLRAAARVAIAGNRIDFGAPGGEVDGDLEARAREALAVPLPPAAEAGLAAFAARARAARRILYVADNAGEIAFDRLLVERLPSGSVTVAVRSAPAINDALRADAEAVGIPEVAEVIESGSGIPGTVLADATPEFRARFAAADLIIAKGQGNFETMDELAAPIAFLLMVKCEVVARRIGLPVGAPAIAVR